MAFSLFVLAAVSAFGQEQEVVNVAINKEVTAKSGLKIAFLEVVEDSRCPEDVQCIWAGNAKIKVRVTEKGRSRVLELNSMLPNENAEYCAYRFKLSGLLPKPHSKKRSEAPYEAAIAVEKIS